MVKLTPDDKSKMMRGIVLMRKRSQAGTVLVAGAILDDVLETTLKSHMPGLDRETTKVLFNGPAPLASMAAKIYLAQALGIVNKALASEIHKLRRIRNLFAHSTASLDFMTPEVRELTDKLAFPKDGLDQNDEQYFVAAIGDAVNRVEEATKRP